MKLQWPIKREKKGPATIVDKLFEKEARIEAGLSEIKGTQFTKFRVERTDEGIIDIINRKIELMNRLIDKGKRTPEDDEMLKRLDGEIDLWQFYRKFKNASVPWSEAGENRDLSQSIRAMEILFFRNANNPEMWDLLKMALEYVSDKCYKEWHVVNPPVLLVQAPGGTPRVDMRDITRPEEVT